MFKKWLSEHLLNLLNFTNMTHSLKLTNVTFTVYMFGLLFSPSLCWPVGEKPLKPQLQTKL